VLREAHGRLDDIKAHRRTGTKSLAHELRMFEAVSNKLCATQKTVEVFFDLENRSSAVVPAEIRKVVEPLMIAP